MSEQVQKKICANPWRTPQSKGGTPEIVMGQPGFPTEHEYSDLEVFHASGIYSIKQWADNSYYLDKSIQK